MSKDAQGDGIVIVVVSEHLGKRAVLGQMEMYQRSWQRQKSVGACRVSMSSWKLDLVGTVIGHVTLPWGSVHGEYDYSSRLP